MKAIKKYFEVVDVFGEPIQFSSNRQYFQTSAFGGVMTVLMIFVVFVITSSGLDDLTRRRNIFTFTEEINYFVPPAINFSTRKLYFALSLNNNTLNDPRFLKLEILQGLEKIDSNGQKNVTIISETLEPCTNEHFPIDFRQNLVRTGKNVSQLLCPRKNLSIQVEGSYSSSEFSYFWIKLSKCQNSTEITCFSDQKIDTVFNEIGRVYLNVYFSNNIISANDFNEPVSSFLDDRIYVMIDRNSYKEKNVFFNQNKILTDTSLINTDIEEELETFNYENIYDETILQIDNSQKNGANITYAGIFFRSNRIGKNYVRTFEKIGKFIGYLGGFWSLLYLFFSVLAKNYNRYKLLLKMANSLYNFSDSRRLENQKKPPNNKANVVTQFSEQKKEIKELSQSEIFHQNIKAFLEKNQGIKLKTTFRSFLKSNFIGLIQFFGCFLKRRSGLFEKEKLRQQALFSVQKDTDIIHLLTKIKEIEKLKTLLLNPSQRKIFDFFSKEKLTKKGKEKHDMSRSTIVFYRKSLKTKTFVKTSQKTAQELIELYGAYKQLMRNEHEKLENFQISEKILRCFDEELLVVFQMKYNQEQESTRIEESTKTDENRKKAVSFDRKITFKNKF